eukprot:TRINITY_DN869_c5_g1_i1.p1 TRINITY_DN869_c5_g1~~TRINITY_DN869_c5_g1_i1.p1  ORF type:complete len:770 (+),score=198.04 TRINITY_DN869_c5_g1_i1:303-2312(+)
MVTNLHQYSHIKGTSHTIDLPESVALTGANKWRRLKGFDRLLDRIDDVKMKMDVNMDEGAFRAKLQETGIMVNKDPERWKFDVISEMLEGPLRNPQYLAESLKTKFMKRLLSWMRPFNRQFSAMDAKDTKYARIACQTLEVLLMSDEGQVFLEKNALVPQIADMLRIEVECDEGKLEKNHKNRLMSKDGVLKTMSGHYFALLGSLSSSAPGIQIIEKFKMFDYLSPMSLLPNRDDLSRLIMTSLDYNLSGPARILLSRSLKAPSKAVRFFATRHLRDLLRSGTASYSEWGVKLLVEQLNDQDDKISQTALMVLEEAADQTKCLDALINRRPALQSHGKKGKDLMIRFLSRPTGFKYWSERNLISSELEAWMATIQFDYMREVETRLADTINRTGWKQKNTTNPDNTVHLPPHFIGELAQTLAGCHVLREQGTITTLVQRIKDYRRQDSSVECRAALWALGNVGKSRTGLDFLTRDEDVVKLIVETAASCQCLAARGAAFYVLGLITHTEKGRTRLVALGWECPNDMRSHVCVPKNVREFGLFRVPAYKYRGSGADSRDKLHVAFRAGDVRQEVLQWVGNLSNHITAETASYHLKSKKGKQPKEFTSPEIKLAVMHYLESFKYPLPVRQFLYTVFDGLLLKKGQFEIVDGLVREYSKSAGQISQSLSNSQ